MKKHMINAGSYRHPITFQQRTTTKNEYGERLDTWTDFATSRAGIYATSGREYMNAMEVQSEMTHKINLRYIPNVTSSMRIKFGTRYFTIITIVNFQEMNRELQLLCKEYSL